TSCFFFQAEDGIRDFHVTGVQTCALPISAYASMRPGLRRSLVELQGRVTSSPMAEMESGSRILSRANRLPTSPEARCGAMPASRSEERRVGKEGRSQRGAQAAQENSQARR